MTYPPPIYLAEIDRVEWHGGPRDGQVDEGEQAAWFNHQILPPGSHHILMVTPPEINPPGAVASDPVPLGGELRYRIREVTGDDITTLHLDYDPHHR